MKETGGAMTISICILRTSAALMRENPPEQINRSFKHRRMPNQVNAMC
jgi:hypothetical protein